MRKLLLLAGLLLPAMSWALPNEFVQEGLVFEDGAALDGPNDVLIRLYANEQGGEPLFEEAHEGTAFFDGYYAVSIGSIEDLSASMILRPTLYLGISINGGRELEPRTAIVKVPAAFVADVAENVVGDITPRTVSIGDALVINEDGQWVGDPSGLRGPAGPPGEGAAIDDVIQSIVDAIEADPDLLPFLRNTVDDSVVDSIITFDGSRLVFDFGGIANALDLGNNNIVNANSLRFNDPGPGEGLSWSGTQASIVVSPLGGANTDGFLRLINDAGISLESNTRIQGNLTITGAIDAVQSITTTVLTATTANITNANITSLNGPNGRVNVVAELNLAGDVRLGGATNFIGVIRNDGGILSGGDIRGRNFAATASITAAGNITAGNRLVGGNGGIWVGNIQVFDGNGNLVRRPIYQCPNGQVMRGTDNNGVAQCVALSCPVGQYLRGIDGNNRAICAADAGLRSIPQRQCPPGQAATAISANGTITCGVPRTAPQTCAEGEFVVGLAANGSVICADAPEGGGGAAAGQCAPGDVRPNILVCTRSSRNVQQFVLPGFNFQIANGCDPNDQTQVMYVTRSGVGSIAARAAAWRAYVNAGGLIITEYNVSDEVYNAIFGTAVRQPAGRRGSCRDNAMPVVKVNLEDPFWVINDDLVVTPAGSSACGYEVGAYPELVPLGGWAANQIGVGYRELGDGRVWLVDADWQDGQAITASSTRMMGLMATWCGGGGAVPPDGPAGLEFEGVRQNVPPAEIVGWRQCHRSIYNQSGLPIANILRDCDGDQIMYGCKSTAAANWQVLAQGARDSVFNDTGRGNVLTVNNGVGWYFNGVQSIGFAPAGQAVTRNSCDTTNMGSNDRICWHSSGGNLNGGWRCGNNTRAGAAEERVIWTKDAGGEPEPPVGNALAFQGIRQNVPDADLEGWRPCHTSRFNTTTNGLQSVVDNDCRGEQVMMGCRPVGAANWNLLAQGRHAQVFRNVGSGRNSVTRENGVDFYYSNSYSMGFVQAGTGVSRSSCDTLRDPGSANRMCWHSSADRMTSGYRCGNTFLNGNANWERRIWVLDAGGGGGPPAAVFPSCLAALQAGNRASGVYNLQPPGEAVRRVHCDQTTDGGGWTLVAATEGQTLNDQRSNYYDDLQTLDPARANAGVWWGLRALGNRWDVRFACRDAVRAADAAFTVDLSVYDVPYYTEFTTGTDAQSCFSEGNGAGDENPPPMRRNNLNNQVRNRGDQWNGGYLEGEDSCGDTGDFTIDFDDRGMDNNQSDGTDWGEDDSSRKCGRSGLGTGQWFIFARERAVAQ